MERSPQDSSDRQLVYHTWYKTIHALRQGGPVNEAAVLLKRCLIFYRHSLNFSVLSFVYASGE